MTKLISICTLAALLAVFSTGCNRDGVKVYHVEKEDVTTPPAVAPGAMPTTAAGLPLPDASVLPKLKYTLPDGWQEKAPSEMRVASFSVADSGKQADVSVIPMSGGGGNLDNVNRWRGQVGLGPVDDDAVQKMTEKVVIAGRDADLFDIAGINPSGGGAERIIASVLHRDDTAWFFKITGDADLVEKNKPSFIAFLKSFQFSDSAAPAAVDLSKLPEGHPPIAGTSLGTQNSLVPNANTLVLDGPNSDGSDKPTWTVPADWQKADPGPMLSAKFSITGNNGTAEVNILLSGMDSGLVSNLTRWRGQLGLPPLTEENLSTSVSSLDLPNGNAQLVDFTGTDSKTGKPARLVGVIVPQNGQTWFYKLMGDPDLVAQQKDAFTKFIQSAKYPDVH